MDEVRGKLFLLPLDDLLAVLDVKAFLYQTVIYAATLQVVNNAWTLCLCDRLHGCSFWYLNDIC